MELKIHDTGYVSNDTELGSQEQLSDTDRAGYTGSAVTAFTVQIENLAFQGETSTESKPIINTTTDSETSLVSVSNRTIAVSAIFDKESSSAVYNTNELYQFLQLERTKGLKLFYPNDLTNTEKTIIETLGTININGTFASATSVDPNVGTVATTTPYLVGRVKAMRVSDVPTGDKWRVSFNFEISG